MTEHGNVAVGLRASLCRLGSASCRPPVAAPGVTCLTPSRNRILTLEDGLYRPADLGDVYRHIPPGPAHVFQEDKPVRTVPVGRPALFVTPHRPQDGFDIDGGDFQWQAGGAEVTLVDFKKVRA